MRKTRLLALVVVLVLVATGVAFGQNAYMKGNNLIHAGLAIGGLAGMYGSSTLPPITAGFEYGFEDKISLGGVVGYSGSKETFFGGEWKYSYIVIGARGGYHFLENNDKLDAYGGVMLGYNIVSSSATSTVTGFGFTASAAGSYMIFGFYGGARYYFSPNFGVYGEVGYGLGYFNIGIAYKL